MSVLNAIVRFLLIFGCCFSMFAVDVFAAMHDLIIPLNRSEIISNYKTVTKVVSDDEAIVKPRLHKRGKFSVVANNMGETYISLMNASGGTIKRMHVKVTEDLPDARRAVNALFPSEFGVQIDYVNGNIVVSGSVSSLEVAGNIEKVIQGFLQKESTHIINLLKVNTSQQVTLMVRIGEVKRSALTRIGSNFTFNDSSNGFNANIVSSSTTRPLSDVAARLAFGNVPGSSILGGLFSGTLAFVLDALQEENAFKLLASPTLTAISGETAKFLAGGEIPVPTMTGSQTIASIDYKPFGVGVEFMPIVIDSSTIRLKVAPEVSEISETGSIITINGSRIPAISTRKASTTVDLSPGESLMIAGLIKNDTVGGLKKVPGVGSIPILGALFRSAEFREGETELVIAVTPFLSDPMMHKDIRFPQFEPSGTVNALLLGKLNLPSDLSLEGVMGYILG